MTETPYLRVVRGEPTAEELAALVAVLAARSAAAPEPARRRRSAWADPARRLGLAHRAGPGAWRRSALLA
ncbi:MAG TPA: acyl-CoA carboxylase epsilon subunit [Mycobacteriales bacterium]